MLLVLKNKLKGLSKSEFHFLRDMTKASKNVYNATLYRMRQHFFNTGKRLTYQTAYHTIKKHHAYSSMPALAAQQSMMMVDRAYASFFGLLDSKRKGYYAGEVNIPNYLDKDGYFVFVLPNNMNRWKDKIKIRPEKGHYKFKEFTYDIPEHIRQHKLKEIRIVPKNNATFFEIEFVYEVEEPDQKTTDDHALSIDLGVNNFATCLDEKSGRSFIMDGKPMKSINRYFNKTKAHLQSILEKQGKKWSKRLGNLSARRTRQLNEYLSQYANFVLQVCLQEGIDRVIVGEGYLAQNGCNLRDKNNQNFTYLPFAKFILKLETKLKMNGIRVETREESYTSKCDHLAGEPMCHHDEYMGTRRPRGLFRSSTGIVLNSDVNGALGIMLKGKGNSNIVARLNSGGVTPPRRIRLGAIQQTSSMRLAKTLFGLANPKPQGKPCGM